MIVLVQFKRDFKLTQIFLSRRFELTAFQLLSFWWHNLTYRALHLSNLSLLSIDRIQRLRLRPEVQRRLLRPEHPAQRAGRRLHLLRRRKVGQGLSWLGEVEFKHGSREAKLTAGFSKNEENAGTLKLTFTNNFLAKLKNVQFEGTAQFTATKKATTLVSSFKTNAHHKLELLVEWVKDFHLST